MVHDASMIPWAYQGVFTRRTQQCNVDFLLIIIYTLLYFKKTKTVVFREVLRDLTERLARTSYVEVIRKPAYLRGFLTLAGSCVEVIRKNLPFFLDTHGHTESHTWRSYGDQPPFEDSLPQLGHTWTSYGGFFLDSFFFEYNNVAQLCVIVIIV